MALVGLRGSGLVSAPCNFPLYRAAHEVAPADPLSALVLGETLAETDLLRIPGRFFR